MSLVSRIESLATRIGDECKLLWAAVNGKAAASHDHNGVYEPANANIQGHIANVIKHIDWTNAASDFKTTGQVKVAGTYFADFVLEATGSYAIDITFQRDATMLAKIHVPLNETDLVFSVGTANPFRLKNDGSAQFHFYGNGNITGTLAQIAGFDSVGNLIEAVFGNAAGTVCQGNDPRLSDQRTPSAGSVSYAKMAADLTGISAVSASDIDWSAAGVFTKTLTAAITFTFSNLSQNKVITLVLSGDYTITLPSYCKVISGVYDGTVTNYIQFHCTNSESGTEQVWIVISQEAV